MSKPERDPDRPDPEVLLARVEAESERARRGKLKIFFGASAGVGKTYAMLAAAQRQAGLGTDVVVGVVETHGRSETAALLQGLEVLPLREIGHRGGTRHEFDLDAALARRPALVLVDELAHQNAPGTRHPKRWQDVDELLDAGIDVYSTINVQHIESLNDVVGGITGVRVWETVPDHVFDEADEVVLVDLPPDELLQRLREGKVYLPEQAQRAIGNFFRKGNLIALRELALRRTADRVDDDMLEYRRERSVAAVWHAKESLLACVGPLPGGDKVVRSASRLASQLGVEWHAVYAETPKLQQLPEAQRARILKTLKLAESLGARTATLSGPDAVQVVLAYARENNLTKIVLGATSQLGGLAWLSALRTTFGSRLRRASPDIDLISVARDPDARLSQSATSATDNTRAPREGKAPSWHGYAWVAAICAATTLAATPLLPMLDLANIVMLFQLAVVVSAWRFGRGPAVAAAVINVAAFDFFFVPPRFSFAVSDVQYLVTFAVMLAIGLVIGHLTAGLRYQARVASHREQRSHDLYEMSRALSGALAEEQVVEIADRWIEQSFRARAVVLLPDGHDKLAEAESRGTLPPTVDPAISQWVFDHAEPAGIGTDTLPASPLLYLPLKAPMRTRGVLVVEPANARVLMIPEQRRQLDTFAVLIAIALERVHFVTIARSATVQIEGERLRNSLLSALSHDLRTPLTALLGAAESLRLGAQPLSPEQIERVDAIRDQAERTSALVENILDMARLESGEVRLRREWQSLEEIVGSALDARATVLANHEVAVELPPDLPLVECDATLIERVLVNLLENAAKYTPAGSRIGISARVAGSEIRVDVADNGPGVPEGKEAAIFEKFARGSSESAIPGLGLGLAICRTIVGSHGGRIWVEGRAGGGADFAFTLPRGTPPAIEPEAGA